ncbi:MAG: hypothetical protein ACYC8T_37130, partial [Myxococcaceae bacterium]
ASLVLAGPERSEATVHLSLLGMGWNLNPAIVEHPDMFLAQFEPRVSKLVQSACRSTRVTVRSIEAGQAQSGLDRKTYLARHAAMRPGDEMSRLLMKKVSTFVGFDLHATSEGSNEIAWFKTMPVALGGEANNTKLYFDPANVAAQPLPQLPDHDLSSGNLEQVIRRLNGNVRATPHMLLGPSPLSLALAILRTSSAPNRHNGV